MGIIAIVKRSQMGDVQVKYLPGAVRRHVCTTQAPFLLLFSGRTLKLWFSFYFY